MDQNSDNDRLDCPQIWIDGYGRLVESVDPSFETSANSTLSTTSDVHDHGGHTSKGFGYVQSSAAEPRDADPDWLPDDRRHNNELIENNSFRAM